METTVTVAPVAEEVVLETTVLTATRNASADLYISPSAGRKVRAEIGDDIAAQYEAVTGESIGFGRNNISYEWSNDRASRVVKTTGTLIVQRAF